MLNISLQRCESSLSCGIKGEGFIVRVSEVRVFAFLSMNVSWTSRLLYSALVSPKVVLLMRRKRSFSTSISEITSWLSVENRLLLFIIFPFSAIRAFPAKTVSPDDSP